MKSARVLLFIVAILPPLAVALGAGMSAAENDTSHYVYAPLIARPVDAATAVGEWEALVTLYGATNGEVWARNDGWLGSGDQCSWQGVACANGRVTTLHLDYNQLRGPLPQSLGTFTELKILHLYGNELSGPIPTTLGDLTKLQELNLSVNRLSGSIPRYWARSLN